MEYNFREIEKRWQSQWVKDKTYHTTEDSAKEKFYVLNMFPYPSGAGLHVGHPLYRIRHLRTLQALEGLQRAQPYGLRCIRSAR